MLGVGAPFFQTVRAPSVSRAHAATRHHEPGGRRMDTTRFHKRFHVQSASAWRACPSVIGQNPRGSQTSSLEQCKNLPCSGCSGVPCASSSLSRHGKVYCSDESTDYADERNGFVLSP